MQPVPPFPSLEINIKTLLVLCVILVARPAVLLSEEPSSPQNQLVLQEGLNYFYNSDSESANRKFDEYIALEPDDPVGYWRKALSMFLRARSEQNTDTPKFSERQREELITLINQGIGRADAGIRKANQPDFNLYVKACLYAIKAGVEFKNVSRFSAGSTIETAVDLAGKSGHPDAKFLLGMLNYRGADQGWSAKLALSFYGVPHDRNTGLSLIFNSATQNTILEKDKPGENLFVDDVWFGVFDIYTEKRNTRDYGRYVAHLFEYLFAKYPHSEKLQKYLKSLNKK